MTITKKSIGIALIIVMLIASLAIIPASAASKCKHTSKTRTYSIANKNKKEHLVTEKCNNCKYSKQYYASHVAGKTTSISSNNDGTHRYTYECRYCHMGNIHHLDATCDYKAPTYTKLSKVSCKQVKYCKLCGFKKQTAIKHQFKNGKCTRCGYKK